MAANIVSRHDSLPLRTEITISEAIGRCRSFRVQDRLDQDGPGHGHSAPMRDEFVVGPARLVGVLVNVDDALAWASCERGEGQRKEAAPRGHRERMPRTCAGSVRMLHIRCRTPPTAIPTIRNGRSKSQTIGYSTSAISARGHEIKNSRHHSRNVNMMRVS